MENKSAGVLVYIENTQKKDKDREHIFIHILKIQIHVSKYVCALHSLPLGRSDLGDVVFWFPGPQKAPG